jgi:hypothetical protein
VYDNEGFNRPSVVADHLSSQGVTVHYVSPNPRLTITGDGMLLEEMTVRLQERGVVFTLGEAIVGWEDEGDAALKDRSAASEARLRGLNPDEEGKLWLGNLRLRNVLSPGERLLTGVEAVVAAVGSESVNALAESLQGRVPELHVIGDAVEPKTVEQATVHGATLARNL